MITSLNIDSIFGFIFNTQLLFFLQTSLEDVLSNSVLILKNERRTEALAQFIKQSEIAL
jgi:hypothetical protein